MLEEKLNLLRQSVFIYTTRFPSRNFAFWSHCNYEFRNILQKPILT